MIDYWKLAKDFKVGDYVQRLDFSKNGLSPFMGRVVAGHPGLGVVDVQWPYGVERIFPDELVKVHRSMAPYLPPALDQAPNTYDINKRKAGRDPWDTTKYPPHFFKDMAKLWSVGASDLKCWDTLYRKYAATLGDDAIVASVDKFYRASHNLFDLFFNRHLKRNAAYWYAENRSYRVTKAEMDAKSPKCPKCSTFMKKTTYKMEEGKRVRLFACPKDLFLLKIDSLHGPDGQPVSW
jgi:ribosomal protein S27AE